MLLNRFLNAKYNDSDYRRLIRHGRSMLKGNR